MADSRYFLRRIPPALRRELFDRDGGICRYPDCGVAITRENFHCAHLRSAAHGGPPILANLAAWCAPCNLKFGNRDALDTRLPLRGWQEAALPILVDALSLRGYATLMAAPGAGKTVEAGRVFDWLLHAGLVHRVLVVVHRVTLVHQWRDALRDQCHIHLDISEGTRGYGRELEGMDGLVTTVQGWQNNETVRRYLEAIRNYPTLVILDEVHHLYRQGLWANRAADIIGDIHTGLRARVLNLSGTLFRTDPAQRMATVQYAEETDERTGELKLRAQADYQIDSATLVKAGLLRRPNLHRIGATVDLVDLKEGTIRTASIADVTDRDERSHAVRKFHHDPLCRQQFVSTLLDQLQKMERDSGHAPVKALLVAYSIAQAGLYADEINRQMQVRRLQPLAVRVTSDDPAAHVELERFRAQRRPGVLCTVQMAGEGYDCPDICVIGYASNIITDMFICQVVARGQRVTAWERERLKRPLSVQVIIPDVPDVVEHFKRVLTPMVRDLDDETGPPPPPPPPPDRVRCHICGTWYSVNRLCPVCHPPVDRVSDIRDPSLDNVTAVADQSAEGYQADFHDHDPRFIELLSVALERQVLPASDAPAFATALKYVDADRPFDEPVSPPRAAADRPSGTRPLSSREEADRLRSFLNKEIRWWIVQHPDQDEVTRAYFVQNVKRAGRITQLDLARPDQLKLALRYLEDQIAVYCETAKTSPPRDFGAWQ